MVSKYAINTIECVAKEQEKISYDASAPISRNDLDARLIYHLGNTNTIQYIDNIPGQEFREGRTFKVSINQNMDSAIEDEVVKYKILKVKNNLATGFNGAIIQNVDTKETIVWADGSKGFENLTKNPSAETLVEILNDWGINDALGVARGEIYPQLRDLKNFVDEYLGENKNNRIHVGIGHSLMGVSMGALALTKGYENIKFRTYSGCVSSDLRQAIAFEEGWGLNDLDGANLESYYTPGEPLFSFLEPYHGANTIYMKEYTNETGIAAHGAEAYFSDNKAGSNYFKLTGFNKEKLPFWKHPLRSFYHVTKSGSGFEVGVNIEVNGLFDKKDALNKASELNKFIKDCGVNADIDIKVQDKTYKTIKTERILLHGSVTKEEIYEENPDKIDNFSDDGTIYLIEPGEEDTKIKMPPQSYKPVDYSPLVSEVDDILSGKVVKTTDLPIQNNIYIPKSSSEGSPTLDNVYYQYTTKPSGGILSKLFTVVQLAASLITQQWWAAAMVAVESGIAGDKVAEAARRAELLNYAFNVGKSAVKNVSALITGVSMNGSDITGFAKSINSGGTFVSAIKPVDNAYNLSEEAIEKILDNTRLVGIVVNEFQTAASGNSTVHSVNVATGSISGSVELNSRLTEPDVSTPDEDKTFKLDVKDRGCPIVLDMDKDGVETLDIDKTNIYFNTQNTNFSTKVGWISGDDAFLAVDKNNDGKITSQQEVVDVK